jgi:acetylornithine deacetylase/succinyl-diaminopimelate desuccinylase-like protein
VFLRGKFEEEGLSDLEVDPAGNVLAKLSGKGSSPGVVVTAHTDTVFPIDTNLNLIHEAGKICGPGIGDNSLGVAGLFGLIWQLRQQGVELPGDLWLVANTCEEGLGDLKGMQAIVDRFSEAPLVYIVIEGMALGQIFHQGLGVQRYMIKAQGEGGHSWVDFGTPSALHELSSLITKLTTLDLPENPRTTMNVGVISGGTSVNTIAAEAELQLDLRSADPATLEALSNQIERLVVDSNRSTIQFQFEVIGKRPAGSIPETHPLVKLASRVLKERGIDPQLNIGSTDANIPLSRGFSSICIGLTTGGGAHTLSEFINTDPLSLGLSQLADVVIQSFNILN